MTTQSLDEIHQQAKYLAGENKAADPKIQDVYWFPDDSEVRLVETTPEVPSCTDCKVHPFYFQPAPQDDLPAPSGIALIKPDEFGQVALPEGWGAWGDAVKL